MSTTTHTAPPTSAPAPTDDTLGLPDGGKKYQNETMITGSLGQHPQLRYTPTGTPVVSFSIAHNENWKNGDELIQRTHWVNIVQFGEKAETTAAGFAKGDTVHIRGALQYQSWETEDQKKRSKLEVKAYDVTLIKKKTVKEEATSNA